MKRIVLTLALWLCVAAIRINDRAYDLISALAHALQRAAGCLQWSVDSRLERCWIQLRTARDMQPASKPAELGKRWRDLAATIARSGDEALSVVLIAASVFCLIATMGDITTAYQEHLIAQWKAGAK